MKSKKVYYLLKLIPDAQQLFQKNILYFRNITGSPSISVASHGDFINTMYHIQNTSLLKSKKIRQKAGVLFEAYDEIVNSPVQKRFADQVLLERFASQVISAIDENASIIMLLTHPRNWEVDFWANTKDNIMRVVQGLLYKV